MNPATNQPRSWRRPNTPGALFVVALSVAGAGAAGCDRICVDGKPTRQVHCAATGSATLTGPPGFVPAGPVQVRDGKTCLTSDGSCAGSSMFTLATAPAGGSAGTSFEAMFLFFGSTLGPTTFQIPSGTANVDGTVGLSPPYLLPVSGEVTVQVSTPAELQAMFDVTLKTEAGVMFSLTSDDVDVRCDLEDGCS